jgi:DNA invertase Pin-like site-specific DNA recombinase
MKIGYARVSKGNAQDNAAQIDALKAAGVERVFQDKASGGTMDRPELRKAIAALGNGDVLIVWKLDRLARSLADLLTILGIVRARSAGFASLTEPVDTTTAAGEMLIHMLGAFAQFERALTRERIHLGLALAKKRGIKLGRPYAARPDQERVWVQGIERGELTIGEAARGLDVSRSTMNRILARHRAQKAGHDDKEGPTRIRSQKIAARYAARRRHAAD